MVRRETTGVLVVGGGMAGLCAALAAAERGADVLVLEKGTRCGGSMLLSNGIVWTLATAADARRLVPDGDAALQDWLVEELGPGLASLESHGAQLEPEREWLDAGRGRQAAPAQLTATLLEGLRVRGGRVQLRTGVQQLLVEQGVVAGALAFDAEGPLEIRAGAVVLATGGFQGNAELLRRYVSPHADAMYLRANPWSTGDGLLAALDAGAATTARLDGFYGHAISAPPTRFHALQFQDMSHKYAPFAVALNLQGRRFADESAGTGDETLNVQVARQPQASAVFVFDQAVADHEYNAGPLARVTFERARAAGAPVAQADTLEALVEAMAPWGVPPEEALATLRDYNAAVQAGTAQRLAPARRAFAMPLAQPPFRAALVRAGITFTSGGLKVDLDMNVLRRSGSVSTLPLVTAPADEWVVDTIPGLHAAGCDVGGFSTDKYMGGLAQALATGRAAGLAAAERVSPAG